MSNYTTVADLKADALWRAGEPTDGSSDYDTVVVTYLNAVQQGLVLGGLFGPDDTRGVTLPVVDWWWARKNPRGVFNTVGVYEQGTVTLVQGTNQALFAGIGTMGFAGYRFRIGSCITTPRVLSHTPGGLVATLDGNWPEATQGYAKFQAFKLEYDLAADFVRFCGQPITPVWPFKINIVDEDTLEEAYPQALATSGVPTLAALIDTNTIRLSHWTSTPMRVEYPYIALPDDLTVGGSDPVLPRHHRRILSVGAAGLVLLDKADNKAATFFTEFKALYLGMLQEYNHHQRRMSRGFGRIEPRLELQAQSRALLQTTSGTYLST